MSKIQVVCNDTGESSYVTAEFKPRAGEYRAVCPDDCGAAEYREPEVVEG